MYVHLGGDLVLAVSEIVAVLDARLLRVSEEMRRFYERAARERRLRGPGAGEQAKSLVVTPTHVYVSPISPATLARRIAAPGGPVPSDVRFGAASTSDPPPHEA